MELWYLETRNFKDQGPEFCKKWAQHFGRLNIHPTSGSPAGHPEYHITYRRADPGEHAKVFSSRTSNISWHSDITYELQPPGITVFAMLQCPRGGGDTLFADTIEAYERLSPRFKKIIEGLKVVHTSRDQAYDAASGGGVQRRAPVDAIHPLVRYHPVTGKKSLFVQKFAKEIIGLKKEESDNILEFLYKHIETSLDLQLRARYEPGTVVIWDNRRAIIVLLWTGIHLKLDIVSESPQRLSVQWKPRKNTITGQSNKRRNIWLRLKKCWDIERIL